MKTTSVKAEEIDGYRGCDDLDSILEFIESKPGSKDDDKKQGTIKRNKRVDKKSAAARKRSRTPSSKKTRDSSRSSSVGQERSVITPVPVPVPALSPTPTLKDQTPTPVQPTHVVDESQLDFTDFQSLEEDNEPFFTVVRRGNKEPVQSGTNSKNNTLRRKGKNKQRVADLQIVNSNGANNGSNRTAVVNLQSYPMANRKSQNKTKPQQLPNKEPVPPPPPPPAVPNDMTIKTRQYAAVVASSSNDKKEEPLIPEPVLEYSRNSIDLQNEDEDEPTTVCCSLTNDEDVESEKTKDISTAESSYVEDERETIDLNFNYDSILKFIKKGMIHLLFGRGNIRTNFLFRMGNCDDGNIKRRQ